MWLTVVVALGVAGTALLVAVLIALIQHVRLLSQALKEFQEQIRPPLDGIAREAGKAQDRLARLSERGLRGDLDARIRR